jgi:TolA-binding protein
MRIPYSRRVPLIVLALGAALSQTACLKTRAQLRDEGGGEDRVAHSAPAPQPQNVQPQGQYVIDEIKGEFTRLEGRVQDLERSQRDAANNPATASRDDMKKLETRIVELEQAQANMLEAIKKLQENPPSAADPADLVKRGQAQLEAGNPEGAASTLTSAMKNAKGKTAEDAAFLRAEAYFAQKDYKKAIVDYSKFPEKFSRSSYMPKALFQIGRCFELLGMKEDAKGFYQELVEKYPKSAEAKKARPKTR